MNVQTGVLQIPKIFDIRAALVHGLLFLLTQGLSCKINPIFHSCHVNVKTWSLIAPQIKNRVLKHQASGVAKGKGHRWLTIDHFVRKCRWCNNNVKKRHHADKIDSYEQQAANCLNNWFPNFLKCSTSLQLQFLSRVI